MRFSIDELTAISQQFESKHPGDVLRWAADTFASTEVAMATGFGAEGVSLIDILAKIGKQIPIFYLDTDVLFSETYKLRDGLEERYGIRFIRYATPVSLEQQAKQYGERLWEQNPNQCCHIRKVEPLKEALKGRVAWITAIRRDQSPTRASAGIVEWDGAHNLIKINPLAHWTKQEVWKYILANDVPYNPLHDQGYPSIGCVHCTSAVAAGEDERAGRWRGFSKTECGLHSKQPA